MSQQVKLTEFLGAARLQPYLDACDGDIQRASNLYQWNMKLGGSLHTQISYVEIAARNAIDVALANWNSKQPHPGGSSNFGREWTIKEGLANPLYSLIKTDLARARTGAAKEPENRHASHPRRLALPTHDDVVSHLTLGTWTKMFNDPNDLDRRDLLWNEALCNAFPGSDQSHAGRQKIGEKMETMRRLRNRAAHHDNVLGVVVAKRLNDMLSLLHDINAEFPTWAMAGSSLRRLMREDPRI
ncbi:MAG: Abi family protein [Actinomycetales bacterium]|nr:Abi family protein [Actinomycetales bacterium]